MKHTYIRFSLQLIIILLTQFSHAQLPSYLPANGLVAWYPFNGNANDESGNGNNGVVNGALLTSDRFESTNKAYYFDGLTSSIVIPHSSDFNFELNNSYSISFWLKPEVLSANQAQIVAMKQEGVGYTQDGWNSFIEPNYKMNFFVQNGSNPYSGCNRGSVTTSIFQHVAQVFRPDSVIVFINGVWAGSEPSNGATVGNNSNSLFFGLPWWGLIYSNTRGYNGILDDVAIYNRALTQTEVAAIYTSTPTNNGGGTTTTTPAPPGIPYQAEVRNESGEVLANTIVNVRFTLHELTANGTVSYQETHALTTNELGLFAATIGAGTATQGTFVGINWAQTTKFLQVEVDTGSGWITMGNQQLMSVPYALYAASSQPGPAGPVGPQGPAGPAGENGQTTLNLTAGYGIEINGDTINALHSIQNLISGGAPQCRIGISSTTNWTCPSGVTQILVEVWGAGGGGGSGVQRCVYVNGCGGGNGGNGGNGGYNRSVISVIPGQVYNVIIGAGGIGGGDACISYVGSNGGCSYGPFCGISDGTDGGNTSFHGLITAHGGTGGKKACIERLCSGWVSSSSNGIAGEIINYPSYSLPHFINPTYMTGYSSPGCCTSGGQGGGAGCPNYGNNGEGGYCIISY